MPTPFAKQCEILSDLWMNYRNDDEIEDFIQYNDLGLPMAHLAHVNLVKVKDHAIGYIDETFLLFCGSLGIDPEKEYDSLEEMFLAQGE